MHKQFTVYMDNPEWVLVDAVTRVTFRGTTVQEVVDAWKEYMGVT